MGAHRARSPHRPQPGTARNRPASPRASSLPRQGSRSVCGMEGGRLLSGMGSPPVLPPLVVNQPASSPRHHHHQRQLSTAESARARPVSRHLGTPGPRPPVSAPSGFVEHGFFSERDICQHRAPAYPAQSASLPGSPRPKAFHPVGAHDIKGARTLLDRERRKEYGVSVKGVQSELRERWAEHEAARAFLNSHLEGTCCTIENLEDDKHGLEDVICELESKNAHLEYLLSDDQKALRQSMLNQDYLNNKEALRLANLEIDRLNDMLRRGVPVELPKEQVHKVQKALDAALTKVTPQASAQVTARTAAPALDPDDDVEACYAAIPGWSITEWVASLAMHKPVAQSLVSHVQKGGPTNGELELRFIQKLGAVGNRDTVLALLRSSSLLDDIADNLWENICDLTSDMEREETVSEAEREAAMMGVELSVSEAEETEETEDKASELEERLSAEREELQAKLHAAHAEVEKSRFDLTELERALAEAGDDKGLQTKLVNELQAMQQKIAEMEARERERETALKQHDEEAKQARKNLRISWKEAKKKGSMKLKRADTDSKLYHDAIKVGTGTFTLAYASTAIHHLGLTKILGPAAARAGEDYKLMNAMEKEHMSCVDSHVYFETPNYGIPTTSAMEWWAVKDPDRGLEVLSIERWPVEKELGRQQARELLPPSAFRSRWEDFNARLQAVGESPLLLHGFCALRLYTGPMYFKYNNVLRGISVEGLKAPLEWLFNKLCMGNTYSNTLHSITGAINKLSRVTTVATVYRAPGGVLPKSFWDDDAHGVKGGVEMGFMSCSKSLPAALEYAKISKVKLLFELKLGMVARGAEISWLSQYPNEDEVLFSPLSACEVIGTRIEGSVLIVELRPGVAPAALQEKMMEQQMEEAKAEAEKDAHDAQVRKEAVEEVRRARQRWSKSSVNVMTAGRRVKIKEHKLLMAQAERKAATVENQRRAEVQEKEALRKLKAEQQAFGQLKLAEKSAAAAKTAAEVDAASKLQKLKLLAMYLKRAYMEKKLQERSRKLALEISSTEEAIAKQSMKNENLHAKSFSKQMAFNKYKKEVEAERAADENRTMLAEALEREAILQVQLEKEQTAVAEGLDRENLLNLRITEKDKKAYEVSKAHKREIEKLDASHAEELDQERANFADADEDLGITTARELKSIESPEVLMEKIGPWLLDHRTVRRASERLQQMVQNGRAEHTQLLTSGCIELIVEMMREREDDEITMLVCAKSLAVLTDCVGADQRAADAGALEMLITAIKSVQGPACEALRNITGVNAQLATKAKELGAKDDWLSSAAPAKSPPKQASSSKLTKQKTSSRLTD